MILRIFLTLWLVKASSGDTLQFDCPTGWDDFDEHCYHFEIYPVLNLHEAKQECRSDGAFVLTVANDLEHEYVVSTLDTLDQGFYRRNWWTSGRRESSGVKEFYWEGDGTKIESYFYWLNSSIPEDKEKDYILYHFDGYQWGWILGKGTEQNPYVCKISKEDVYKVMLDERDRDYGVDSPNPEDILHGPEFTKQPKDRIFEPSMNPNTVSDQTFLECVTQANPLPSYEWFKERGGVRTQIDPLANQRYTFVNGRLIIDRPSTERGDDGGYQCAANNDFGRIVSNKVQLSFGYLQDFPKSPRSPVQATAFKGISLECNPPPHFPSILYAWYKNEPDNYIQSHLKPYIFISNNGGLYFSEVTQDDVGQYYCVVTKPGMNWNSGATSMPTELRVVEGSPGIFEPQIGTEFPAVFPQSPMVGDNVRIECLASGTSRPPLEYSWDKLEVNADGTVVRTLPLPNQAKLSDHNRVLTIPGIQLYDGGTYRCNVVRRYGLGSSRTTQVILQATPHFVVPLTNQWLDEGSVLNWRCEAAGEPAVSYFWIKNGLPIEDVVNPDDLASKRIEVSNNGLKISDLNAEKDDGMYQCGAHNLHATRYSSAELRVLSFAPSFVKFPLQLNQFATNTGNNTIICRPEAAPTPTITWFKNGGPLNPGTDEGSRVRQMPNGNLFISPVYQSDEGTYTCRAENKHGTTESSGELTVLNSITISQPPLATTIAANQSGFLHCIASYNPQLDITYTWYHGDMLVEFEKIFRLGENRYEIWHNPHYRRGSGYNIGGIYIMNARTEHTGKYTCIVESTGGDEFTRSADVRVVGPPSEPAGATLVGNTVTTSSVRLQWKAAGNNGGTILSYVIEAFNFWEGFWRIIETNVKVIPDSSSTYTYDVTGLRPFSSYQLRLRAENSYGTSIPSQPSEQFHMLAVMPDLYPDMVGGGGGKVGELQVTWKPLEPWEENGEGFGYLVYWKPAGDPEFGERIQTVEGNEGRYMYLVGEDNFYRQYDVALQAYNDLGQGPMSPIVTIRSAMALPTAIATNVRAQPLNSTSCKVTWEEVKDTRDHMMGKLGGYRVSYWPSKYGPDYENAPRVTLNGQMSEGMVIGLNPNMQYYFAVYVWNEAGNGPKSQWFLQRTLRNAPINQPTEVQVYRKGSHAVHAYWRGVSTTNVEEPLESYKVLIWREGEDIKFARHYNSGKDTDMYIDELRDDILYKLRVCGYSRGGDGTLSSPAVTFVLGGAAHAQISLSTLVLTLLCVSLCKTV